METNVSASTGKSTYKCDSCKKLMGDTANEHSIARSNQKEGLPTEIQCSASRIGDNNNSLRAQLEAVRANGICTMSLVVMVSKLSSEVTQLRFNETLKTQLCDLQQVPSHVPSTQQDAASCAIATNSTAKSYRDVVCALSGKPDTAVVTALATNSLPEQSIVLGDNPSDGDFVTVVRKKQITPYPVSTAAVANTTKEPWIVMTGVRSSSSLSVVQMRVCRKSLFVSRFSLDVTASDVEKSLKDQLQLASLACTRLKTKHNSYASFHVSVAEDDFHLINNTSVWPNDCLIVPYYGRLNPDQIYTVEAPATSRPTSPGASSLCSLTPPPLDPVGNSVNNVVAQWEGAPAFS
jgi:hypothetical protein